MYRIRPLVSPQTSLWYTWVGADGFWWLAIIASHIHGIWGGLSGVRRLMRDRASLLRSSLRSSLWLHCRKLVNEYPVFHWDVFNMCDLCDLVCYWNWTHKIIVILEVYYIFFDKYFSQTFYFSIVYLIILYFLFLASIRTSIIGLSKL